MDHHQQPTQSNNPSKESKPASQKKKGVFGKLMKKIKGKSLSDTVKLTLTTNQNLLAPPGGPGPALENSRAETKSKSDVSSNYRGPVTTVADQNHPNVRPNQIQNQNEGSNSDIGNLNDLKDGGTVTTQPVKNDNSKTQSQIESNQSNESKVRSSSKMVHESMTMDRFSGVEPTVTTTKSHQQSQKQSISKVRSSSANSNNSSKTKSQNSKTRSPSPTVTRGEDKSKVASTIDNDVKIQKQEPDSTVTAEPDNIDNQIQTKSKESTQATATETSISTQKKPKKKSSSSTTKSENQRKSDSKSFKQDDSNTADTESKEQYKMDKSDTKSTDVQTVVPVEHSQGDDYNNLKILESDTINEQQIVEYPRLHPGQGPNFYRNNTTSSITQGIMKSFDTIENNVEHFYQINVLRPTTTTRGDRSSYDTNDYNSLSSNSDINQNGPSDFNLTLLCLNTCSQLTSGVRSVAWNIRSSVMNNQNQTRLTNLFAERNMERFSYQSITNGGNGQHGDSDQQSNTREIQCRSIIVQYFPLPCANTLLNGLNCCGIIIPQSQASSASTSNMNERRLVSHDRNQDRNDNQLQISLTPKGGSSGIRKYQQTQQETKQQLQNPYANHNAGINSNTSLRQQQQNLKNPSVHTLNNSVSNMVLAKLHESPQVSEADSGGYESSPGIIHAAVGGTSSASSCSSPVLKFGDNSNKIYNNIQSNLNSNSSRDFKSIINHNNDTNAAAAALIDSSRQILKSYSLDNVNTEENDNHNDIGRTASIDSRNTLTNDDSYLRSSAANTLPNKNLSVGADKSDDIVSESEISESRISGTENTVDQGQDSDRKDKNLIKIPYGTSSASQSEEDSEATKTSVTEESDDILQNAGVSGIKSQSQSLSQQPSQSSSFLSKSSKNTSTNLLLLLDIQCQKLFMKERKKWLQERSRRITAALSVFFVLKWLNLFEKVYDRFGIKYGTIIDTTHSFNTSDSDNYSMASMVSESKSLTLWLRSFWSFDADADTKISDDDDDLLSNYYNYGVLLYSDTVLVFTTMFDFGFTDYGKDTSTVTVSINDDTSNHDIFSLCLNTRYSFLRFLLAVLNFLCLPVKIAYIIFTKWFTLETRIFLTLFTCWFLKECYQLGDRISKLIGIYRGRRERLSGQSSRQNQQKLKQKLDTDYTTRIMIGSTSGSEQTECLSPNRLYAGLLTIIYNDLTKVSNTNNDDDQNFHKVFWFKIFDFRKLIKAIMYEQYDGLRLQLGGLMNQNSISGDDVQKELASKYGYETLQRLEDQKKALANEKKQVSSRLSYLLLDDDSDSLSYNDVNVNSSSEDSDFDSGSDVTTETSEIMISLPQPNYQVEELQAETLDLTSFRVQESALKRVLQQDPLTLTPSTSSQAASTRTNKSFSATSRSGSSGDSGQKVEIVSTTRQQLSTDYHSDADAASGSQSKLKFQLPKLDRQSDSLQKKLNIIPPVASWEVFRDLKDQDSVNLPDKDDIDNELKYSLLSIQNLKQVEGQDGSDSSESDQQQLFPNALRADLGLPNIKSDHQIRRADDLTTWGWNQEITTNTGDNISNGPNQSSPRSSITSTTPSIAFSNNPVPRVFQDNRPSFSVSNLSKIEVSKLARENYLPAEYFDPKNCDLSTAFRSTEVFVVVKEFGWGLKYGLNFINGDGELNLDEPCVHTWVQQIPPKMFSGDVLTLDKDQNPVSHKYITSRPFFSDTQEVVEDDMQENGANITSAKSSLKSLASSQTSTKSNQNSTNKIYSIYDLYDHNQLSETTPQFAYTFKILEDQCTIEIRLNLIADKPLAILVPFRDHPNGPIFCKRDYTDGKLVALGTVDSTVTSSDKFNGMKQSIQEIERLGGSGGPGQTSQEGGQYQQDLNTLSKESDEKLNNDFGFKKWVYKSNKSQSQQSESVSESDEHLQTAITTLQDRNLYRIINPLIFYLEDDKVAFPYRRLTHVYAHIDYYFGVPNPMSVVIYAQCGNWLLWKSGETKEERDKFEKGSEQYQKNCRTQKYGLEISSRKRMEIKALQNMKRLCNSTNLSTVTISQYQQQNSTNQDAILEPDKQEEEVIEEKPQVLEPEIELQKPIKVTEPMENQKSQIQNQPRKLDRQTVDSIDFMPESKKQQLEISTKEPEPIIQYSTEQQELPLDNNIEFAGESLKRFSQSFISHVYNQVGNNLQVGIDTLITQQQQQSDSGKQIQQNDDDHHHDELEFLEVDLKNQDIEPEAEEVDPDQNTNNNRIQFQIKDEVETQQLQAQVNGSEPSMSISEINNRKHNDTTVNILNKAAASSKANLRTSGRKQTINNESISGTNSNSLSFLEGLEIENQLTTNQNQDYTTTVTKTDSVTNSMYASSTESQSPDSNNPLVSIDSKSTVNTSKTSKTSTKSIIENLNPITNAKRISQGIKTKLSMRKSKSSTELTSETNQNLSQPNFKGNAVLDTSLKKRASTGTLSILSKNSTGTSKMQSPFQRTRASISGALSMTKRKSESAEPVNKSENRIESDSIRDNYSTTVNFLVDEQSELPSNDLTNLNDIASNQNHDHGYNNSLRKLSSTSSRETLTNIRSDSALSGRETVQSGELEWGDL